VLLVSSLGFDEGQPKIEEHKEQIPNSSSSVCTVDDGTVKWQSQFKGPLFSYDKSKDTHHVVWVPKSNYDWISSLISGEKYLWSDIVKDEGFLVFNKETQALEEVPIPELKDSNPGALRISKKGVARSLHRDGSSLYIEEQAFDDGKVTSIPLTLPSTINVEEEFKNATKCSPNS
jgi:hypothetical protein